MNFIQTFKAARSVSTPLIVVRTPDPASTIRSLSVAAAELAKALKEAEPAVLTHDVANGLKAFNDEGKKAMTKLLGNSDQKATAAPPNFLKLINRPSTEIDKTLTDALIFMANGQRFWNDPLVMQALWNLRDTYKVMGATLVILATFGATLPPELTQDVLIIDEPLPTDAELEEIINNSFKDAQNYLPKLKAPKKEIVTRAASALRGLAAFPCEQQTAMSISESGLNLDDLVERKRGIIEQSRGLSIMRETMKFADLGGLGNVKSFFSKLFNGPSRPDGIVFTDEIEKVFAGFGTDSSGTTTKSLGALLSYMENRKIAGSLFVGPAGSGKTAVAQSLGNEFGVLAINADFSAMEASHVGETGEYIRAALAIITAMFRRPLFVATCNRFGVLPPELLRRYWLPTFYMDLPTTEERKLIWPIQMKAFNIPEQATPLAAEANHWTGAEIRNCCRNAHDLNVPLGEAAEFIVPVSVSGAEGIRDLRAQATDKFISAAIPGLYRHDGDAAPTTTTTRRIRFNKTDADVLDS